MYSIDRNREARIVEVTMAGFWDLAEMDRFESAMEATVFALRSTRIPWGILADASDMAIQGQDIVARHTALFAKHADVWAGRVAMVTPSALMKLQTGRVVAGDGMSFFGDVATARAWLISQN